ncbi:hypothetical protein ACFU7Y_07360 [Kitasatospora sp. NPDC057542]|uniref:hypothetical protein n=1 Tax=Streptomycetaceae TaxID=2062 RepID=UPI001CD01B77|nr:hypothetical protein [Streptomyces sp. LS1784]
MSVDSEVFAAVRAADGAAFGGLAERYRPELRVYCYRMLGSYDEAEARVFPMLFHWTGHDVVLSTFFPARKIAALRAKPDVAITIDAAGTPPQALLIRGRAQVTDVDGIVPEYRLTMRRYAGDEQGAAQVAAVDRPGVRMARIAVRPAWVGVLDFLTRFPGDSTAAEFNRRGQA